MSEGCSVVSEPAAEPAPNNEDREDKDESGSSPGRSSPEGNCPICLGKVENKSFTDSCFHQFCFLCLLEWSKVKAECPLCKRNFTSIIHSVQSIENYEQYHLGQQRSATEGVLALLHTSTQIPPQSQHSRWGPIHPREPFRYRTTTVSTYLDYVARLESAISSHVLPSLPPPPGFSTSATSSLYYRRDNRRLGTTEFRRNIYQQGLWAQRTTDFSGRVRESSPEFYRTNPAQCHRLVPWLNREFNVLCPHDSRNALDRILELIKRVSIRSPEFAVEVSRYVGRHTEHFVHEFHTFAISPYDLTGYDRHAQYSSQSALAHLVLSENSDSSNDSDVQIVSSTTSTLPPIQLVESASDSDEVVVVDTVPARQQPIEVVTLDSDEEVVQVNVDVNINSTVHSDSHVNHSEDDRRRPAKKRRLVRNWLTMSNLSLPSTSSNMNVSINIGRSRSRSSSSSSSSSSSYRPHKRKTNKKKKKKIKEKKGRKEKNVKSKPSLPKKTKADKNTHKKETLVKADTEIPSELPDDKNLTATASEVKVEHSSDDDRDVLRIETDQEFSSSSSDIGTKNRLQSVVLKTVKQESNPTKLVLNLPDESVESVEILPPDNTQIKKYQSSSVDSDSDIYKPSCSYKTRKGRTNRGRNIRVSPDINYDDLLKRCESTSSDSEVGDLHKPSCSYKKRYKHISRHKHKSSKKKRKRSCS